MSSAVSEEEVMRMRLLVDGDGLGDDRRLNMLLKVFSHAASIQMPKNNLL